MRIFLWHVHDVWTAAFVAGRHEYVVPVLPGRGPYGRGRAPTWPAAVREVTLPEAARTRIDVVLLQRPEELRFLARRWLGGRRPGRDLPAIYVEHDPPAPDVTKRRHPAADRPDLMLVHVSYGEGSGWDSGTTPTRVIERGGDHFLVEWDDLLAERVAARFRGRGPRTSPWLRVLSAGIPAWHSIRGATRSISRPAHRSLPA